MDPLVERSSLGLLLIVGVSLELEESLTSHHCGAEFDNNQAGLLLDFSDGRFFNRLAWFNATAHRKPERRLARPGRVNTAQEKHSVLEVEEQHRPGIVWCTGPIKCYATLAVPGPQRWGIWQFQFVRPLRTIADARWALEEMLPVLRPKWEGWAATETFTATSQPIQSERRRFRWPWQGKR